MGKWSAHVRGSTVRSARRCLRAVAQTNRAGEAAAAPGLAGFGEQRALVVLNEVGGWDEHGDSFGSLLVTPSSAGPEHLPLAALTYLLGRRDT
jgi:hypothetical protein